jgi:anti-anti-sigma factor
VIKATTIGYATVLTASGEIDITTAPNLRSALDAVLLSAERDVWIDLTDITFMDSTGAHVVLEANAALERDHRRLSIIAPPGPARRTIEAAGLADALPLFNTRSDAHHHG